MEKHFILTIRGPARVIREEKHFIETAEGNEIKELPGVDELTQIISQVQFYSDTDLARAILKKLKGKS